jgi:hypothetical protein
MFLGGTADPTQPIASSSGSAHLAGRTASEVVPIGDSEILLVMHPTKELGGTLLADLPWLLALVGLALTLGAALLVERVVRRRE